ncbi:phage portal protein [Yinghuangia aomiensis]
MAQRGKTSASPPSNHSSLRLGGIRSQRLLSFYRIPAYQVDPTVSSTWGSGVEEANRFFITQTLSPWLVRIEQAISTFLLAGNRYMKFNLDARLRAKTSERYAAYAVGSQNGWLSADEIRAMEDMEPIPGDQGNGFYRLSTLVPLDHDPANTSAPEGTSTGLEDPSGTGDTQ